MEAKDRRPDALGDLRVLPDETLCSILANLTPRDVGRLSCVSSVVYILCNEEPLWMSLCLNNINHPLVYKGSWKRTTLHQLHLPIEYEQSCRKPLHFDGFSSLFLYRRLYRCYTTLDGFSFDNGNVERKSVLSSGEFSHQYDGQKPVLISALADTWPAKHTWTTDQLLQKYGDTTFRISQRTSRKIKMLFKDYVSYMQIQHDEDPLYIFDDKFAEAAPGLMKDYSVPHLFQQDFFDVLDNDKRPPFRWLIIGPERSGASWHVDPALTSAWNTLLCGRKRWALYPPGKVPSGVTVHVNEEDGDVNIETPTSLQWWLDFYPLLADEDKPIECTQLPGETIYVPSGWWHCVLNLDTTIAVTQNFVNSKNFEFVCLDMAPGYQHKGVCRAGLLALNEGSFEDDRRYLLHGNDSLSYLDLTRKEKRVRTCNDVKDSNHEIAANDSDNYDDCKREFAYDINFLAMFLDIERDHYNSLWSSGNCIGQREMREWLWKLWVAKPTLRDLIWKGACIALNVRKWFDCMVKICAFHGVPLPMDDEKLPVGTGSNPVFLVGNNVIKIYVEEGLEASLHAFGTEVEFYSLLHKVDSPLNNHVPGVLASGIICVENDSYKIVPWDGKGVPAALVGSGLINERCCNIDFPFGIWGKKQLEYRKSGISGEEYINFGGYSKIWPYIVTKRCKGKIFAELKDNISLEDTLNLASFLGEQLRYLHLLPCPSLKNLTCWDGEQKMELLNVNMHMKDATDENGIPAEWELFIKTLNRKKKNVISRLTKWGDPIPSALIEKVDDYLPSDFAELFNYFEDYGDNCMLELNRLSWIHSDIMDDNIHMEPHWVSSKENTFDTSLGDNDYQHSSNGHREKKSWRPCHILDFSDMSIGDPLCDIIPIYLDVFRGDAHLLKRLLESYKLPLMRIIPLSISVRHGNESRKLSYLAMCHCILHEENVLGAIFSLRKELRKASSWEEVEETVWGVLNDYTGFG